MHVSASWGGVSVYLSVRADDPDGFDAAEIARWETSRHKRGEELPFRVLNVKIGSGRGIDLSMPETAFVNGLRYKKNGTVGLVRASARMKVSDLPEHVQTALREKWAEVVEKIRDEVARQ